MPAVEIFIKKKKEIPEWLINSFIHAWIVNFIHWKQSSLSHAC
jgi:hypothetical protein